MQPKLHFDSKKTLYFGIFPSSNDTNVYEQYTDILTARQELEIVHSKPELEILTILNSIETIKNVTVGNVLKL